MMEGGFFALEGATSPWRIRPRTAAQAADLSCEDISESTERLGFLRGSSPRKNCGKMQNNNMLIYVCYVITTTLR